MKPDLQEQYILITGAGRGLGRHAALHLASCGALIGAADIDSKGCEQTVVDIKAQGGQAWSYDGDMSNPKAFKKVAADFASKGGRIDAIINNAMLLHYCPVEEVQDDTLSSMLNIGIKAPVWAAQALVQHYNADKGAMMINMASPVVNRGYPNTVAYSAVKAAIVSITKVLSAELGPRGIRVNAVSPASVPTPGALGIVNEEEYAKRKASIPLRRIGTEADNSNAIAFLLSPEASFINGEVLNVDGGVAAAGG